MRYWRGPGGHVVGHDVQTHFVQNGVQRRGAFRQDAGDDDGQLLGGGGLASSFSMSASTRSVCSSLVMKKAFEDVAALGGGDLRVLGQHLVDLPHSGVVAVVGAAGRKK